VYPRARGGRQDALLVEAAIAELEAKLWLRLLGRLEAKLLAVKSDESAKLALLDAFTKRFYAALSERGSRLVLAAATTRQGSGGNRNGVSAEPR
jgi:hypothetical protein